METRDNMDNRMKGRLGLICRESLFSALVFSFFEGIYLRMDFPLFTIQGAIENSVRNLGLFLLAGLSAHLIFSLRGKLSKTSGQDATRLVLSTLISFPVYFFLFSRLEGNGGGWIYRFLSDPAHITILLTLPVLLFFFVMSRFLRKTTLERFTGALTATFFFINVGYQYVNCLSVVKGNPMALIVFFAVLFATAMIYLVTVKLQKLIPGETGRWRKVALMLIPVIALITVFRHSFDSTDPGGQGTEKNEPNVLLIILDTARSDRFSCYGYERDTTPFLRSFCEDAVLYRNTVAPAPWTIPSHASIFTGVYPSAHGVWKPRNILEDRFRTLAEYLSMKGYDTLGVCNNPYISRGSGLTQGFKTYAEMWKENVMTPALYYRVEWFVLRFMDRADGGASTTNHWVREWLELLHRPSRPFFVFINLMEAHLWSDAPDPVHEKYLRKGYSPVVKNITDKELGPILTGDLPLSRDEWQDYNDIYDADIYYLDSQLRELFSYLEARRYLANTIVVITADHGDHLGEHQMISHVFSLYEPLVRVPLVIRVPDGLPELHEIAGPVQTVDIYPTIMDLLGDREDMADARFQGASLVGKEASPHDFTISEYQFFERPLIASCLESNPGATGILKYQGRSLKAFTVGSLKYIRSSRGDSELYDLSTDPGENHNLIKEREKTADLLDGRLTEWLSSFEHNVEEAGGRELDEETQRRLRALGYVN